MSNIFIIVTNRLKFHENIDIGKSSPEKLTPHQVLYMFVVDLMFVLLSVAVFTMIEYM